MDGTGAWMGPAAVAAGVDRTVLSGHIAFPAPHMKRRATYLIHHVTQSGAVSSKLFS